MVPTMIGMMLEPSRASDPSGSRACSMLTYGASPMPGALLEQLLDAVPRPRHLPGLRHDRVVGGAHRARPRRAPRRRRAPALGRAAAARRRAVDPGRRRQAASRRARPARCARAAGNFMREYWNKPEATADAFRDGWYHSGDAGYLDDDGYLFLVDRVKDMIVTGGENVYSVEVENAIASHPAVAQVAVIGIPSREVGRGRARDRRVRRRARPSPRPRSSSTPASGSPATRCRSRSRSAPSRCRCRAR